MLLFTHNVFDKDDIFILYLLQKYELCLNLRNNDK